MAALELVFNNIAPSVTTLSPIESPEAMLTDIPLLAFIITGLFWYFSDSTCI